MLLPTSLKESNLLGINQNLILPAITDDSSNVNIKFGTFTLKTELDEDIKFGNFDQEKDKIQQHKKKSELLQEDNEQKKYRN